MSAGFVGSRDGYIYDQTEILRRIENGLTMYNESTDPLITLLCHDYTEQQMKIDQAPLDYEEEGDGGLPGMQKSDFRTLEFPLKTYGVRSGFTDLAIEDIKEQEFMQRMNAGFIGGRAREIGNLMYAILTKRTAGAIGTAYQASFFNGETDVPSYMENTFASAHSHYAGINTTTLAREHITGCVEDISEHGYMGPFIGLFALAQQSDLEAIANESSKIQTPEKVRVLDQGVLNAGFQIGGVQCMVHPNIPAGYFTVLHVGDKPMGRRQHPEEKYRGLRFVAGKDFDPDNPLANRRFRIRLGYAARLLGAGACRQIVASATYTNPTMRFQQ